ncbi:restriction endonuclease subunit S [Aeromonas diversa]|uniref:restriction endonuclease subunit S n=1 Tax=Aeromonas diversa TaxID=502790 RepID=UPI0039A39B93
MIAAEPKTAGQYQPYPEYKDSGVAWLGNTPSHWAVFHGKRLLSQRRETAKPESTQLAASQAYGVIPQSLLMEMTGNKVMLALKGTENFKHVSENDFVISLRSFEGGIEHSAYSGCVSPAYTVLQSLKAIHPWFYRYLFKSSPYIAALQASTDSLRDGKSITFEQFGAISLPLPSPEEQYTIAAFLDYETARIDRLIAQQQRLIELLKEKRQAVISHAVTKGLNPDAPMKDSSVEWLGQIPDHWLSNRVGWCCQVGNGCTPSRDNMDYWSEGTYPWLNSGKVNDGYIISAEQFVTVTALKECSLPKVPAGSIVMAITGEGKTRGSVAMTGIDTTLSQHLAFITVTSTKISPMYLCIWLESQYQRIRFESEGWGSTKAAITCSDIKSYPLPEPPLNEQSKIVEYVGERSKTFDLLIQKSESMISVLQERRTALISAAVTGKIDLRGWTPPSDEEAA